MSIFHCNYCGQQKDADFKGHNQIGKNESCDDCLEEFFCPYCEKHMDESSPNADGDHLCKCGNHQFN